MAGSLAKLAVIAMAGLALSAAGGRAPASADDLDASELAGAQALTPVPARGPSYFMRYELTGAQPAAPSASGPPGVLPPAPRTTPGPPQVQFALPPRSPGETDDQYAARVRGGSVRTWSFRQETQGKVVRIAGRDVQFPPDAYVQGQVSTGGPCAAPLLAPGERCVPLPYYVIRRGESGITVSVRTGEVAVEIVAPGEEGAFDFLKEALR